ncbi:fumarylacetoacetase [Hydrogenophaga sp. ANAO-22]|uniref:fumarylacetoacetase n=1 Tax=Hydrogenophaga sp. ANAO-22 TaxID=3166645 RepID=UPI0036D24AC5
MAPPRIDDTHGAGLQSWLAAANDPATDFPIQNLPYGRFRVGDEPGWRIGVAIGDQVLDLQRAGVLDHSDMARLLALAPEQRRALRRALSEGLRQGSPKEATFKAALHPQARVRMGMPCDVGDYTDFYTGIHHATTVGKLFRPDNPLLPNYKWVPIGYHGRASTLRVSPDQFKRPMGQLSPGNGAAPTLQPTKRLDHELELGLVIGQPSQQGEPIAIEDAEDHLFGIVLLNDWSARDIQAWEYQPLGPFLSKNFASTLSPWIVTLEALAPYRQAFTRPDGDPAPLPYLDSASNREQGAIDIALEAWVQTAAMRAAGHAAERLSRSNFTDAYWTAAQLVTHHTVNGCDLRAGDLLGSGTLSGPAPEQGGSLLELTQGGQRPLTLANGETLGFLADGDTIVLRAHCEREGYRRIGFGECRGTVLPR